MQTADVTTKRLPGMPDRLLDHIVSQCGLTIDRDDDLHLVSIQLHDVTIATARNNTALLIKIFELAAKNTG